MNLLELIESSISVFKWSEEIQELTFITEKSVILKFPKCHLLIHADTYCIASVSLISPNDRDINFDLIDVLNNIIPNYRTDKSSLDSLNLQDSYEISSCENRILISLNNSMKIIDAFLLKVLKGDFSWVEKQIEFERNEKFIQQKLRTVFIYEHPAYEKLIKGDDSWVNEL